MVQGLTGDGDALYSRIKQSKFHHKLGSYLVEAFAFANAVFTARHAIEATRSIEVEVVLVYHIVQLEEVLDFLRMKIIEIQCLVKFIIILAPESTFIRLIIVDNQLSNDKAVLLSRQKKLFSSAVIYIKLTGHCT